MFLLILCVHTSLRWPEDHLLEKFSQEGLQLVGKCIYLLNQLALPVLSLSLIHKTKDVQKGIMCPLVSIKGQENRISRGWRTS